MCFGYRPVNECYIMLTLCSSHGKYLILNMRTKLKWLTALCLITILALIALQGYWFRKYYQLTTDMFTREVNMVFEDAVKKEFSLRADTIQEAIKNKLLDTNVFNIKSRYNEKFKKMVYTIQSKAKLTDIFSTSFSLQSYDKAIGNDSVRIFIANRLANMLRNEDLENHIIYYRTQTLGTFMSDITGEMQFDTTRLRPVLDAMLDKRNIHVPYAFLTRSKDSTFHESNFPDSLLKIYPVITRSLPTYSNISGQEYVRVMFRNPFFHILLNMRLVLTAAVLLSLLMSGCLYLLLSSLYREKRLSVLKSDFISNITHEFKTPLATATIAIEAIQTDETFTHPEKTIRYLNHARNELEHLSHLTDKILKLALYEREDQVIKKEKLTLLPLLNDIADTFRFSPEAVIHIHNESGTEWLTADETQFRHAISNVLDNALKYGSREIDIRLSLLSEKEKMLLINIRDFGPGIPEHALPHIFDKFYRVAGQQAKGYGLGLHYVQQILKLHHGWCKVLPENPGLTIQLAWPV